MFNFLENIYISIFNKIFLTNKEKKFKAYADKLMHMPFKIIDNQDLNSLKWKYKIIYPDEKNKEYKNILGLTNMKKKCIFINYNLLQNTSLHKQKEIFLHEIAHALTYIKYNKFTHCLAFRSICKQIKAKPNKYFYVD